MALTVTEEWIRERVGLKHNNLEDVRSLSLPGTYHEKIGALGDGIRKFSRLKALDLSRNAVESLAGLESLKMLEKLNLYYNNVSSLQELYRLRYNQKLSELDLRLNPVARNEPDYRLFLIHMLPNLRRLDDRAVRDTERKAALMHFTTDQANEMTERPPAPPAGDGPTLNPRVQHVRTLAKPHNVVDEDDARILDYARPKPERGYTGSDNTGDFIEDYSPEAIREMNCAGVGLNPGPYPGRTLPPASKDQQQQQQQQQQQKQQQQQQQATLYSDDPFDQLAARYPNLAMSMPPPGAPDAPPNRIERQQQRDPNLQFEDEVDAYTSFKAQGFFTPNPADTPSKKVPENEKPQEEGTESEPPLRGVELYGPDHPPPKMEEETEVFFPVVSTTKPAYVADEEVDRHPPITPSSKRPPNHQRKDLADDAQIQGSVELGGEFGDVITKVSGLVDKYWNGSRSLLRNQRFQTQMTTLLRQVQSSDPNFSATNGDSEDVSRLKQQLEKLKKDNEDLKDRLFSGSFDGDGGGSEDKTRSALTRAQRDLKIVRDRLQKSLDENKALSAKLQQSECHSTSVGTAVGQDASVDGAQIADLATENNRLREQLNSLNIQVKRSAQMQELAAMLQQSHKSLVQTNDHLLRELEETKRKHQDELQQLNWTYQQLKRSVATGRTSQHNGGS